jgi:hypothetical protein
VDCAEATRVCSEFVQADKGASIAKGSNMAAARIMILLLPIKRLAQLDIGRDAPPSIARP